MEENGPAPVRDLRSVQPLLKAPRVSVVIVTYKGASFVGSCLDHVGSQTFSDAEVIIVENGSADGTSELVRERYTWAKLVESAKNLGFTGGVNLGVKRARGELIALLNNDGHPESRWLQELVELYDKVRPDDIVSSVIMNEGAAALEQSQGWTLNVLGRSHRHPGTPPDFLFFGAGAGMLFRKAAYDPPFPEFYFIYNEDAYLGWLARLRGESVHVALSSRVRHEGSATMKKMRSVGAFHGEKNRMTNNLIFWERSTLYRLLPLLVLDFVFHLRRYPLPLLRALAWVIARRRTIRALRHEIQASRKVPDDEILQFVSSQVTHGRGKGVELANAFSSAYCRAFGVTTMESSKTFASGRISENSGRAARTPIA